MCVCTPSSKKRFCCPPLQKKNCIYIFLVTVLLYVHIEGFSGSHVWDYPICNLFFVSFEVHLLSVCFFVCLSHYWNATSWWIRDLLSKSMKLILALYKTPFCAKLGSERGRVCGYDCWHWWLLSADICYVTGDEGEVKGDTSHVNVFLFYFYIFIIVCSVYLTDPV